MIILFLLTNHFFLKVITATGSHTNSNHLQRNAHLMQQTTSNISSACHMLLNKEMRKRTELLRKVRPIMI